MSQHNQQVIKGSIAVVIAAAVLGILSILGSSLGDVTGKIFVTCYSLVIFGLFAAPCMVVAEKPAYKALGVSGIVVAALGFLFTLITILGKINDEETVKFIIVFFVLSFALAQVSFLFHINIQNKYAGYARIGATLAITVFSFIILTQSFQSLTSFYMMAANQEIFKMVGGSFFASLAAMLLVPLCNRLQVDEPAHELSFTEEEQPQPPTTTAEEITSE